MAGATPLYGTWVRSMPAAAEQFARQMAGAAHARAAVGDAARLGLGAGDQFTQGADAALGAGHQHVGHEGHVVDRGEILFGVVARLGIEILVHRQRTGRGHHERRAVAGRTRHFGGADVAARPPLFSTSTGWPRTARSSSASRRASTSVAARGEGNDQTDRRPLGRILRPRRGGSGQAGGRQRHAKIEAATESDGASARVGICCRDTISLETW